MNESNVNRNEIKIDHDNYDTQLTTNSQQIAGFGRVGGSNLRAE